METVSMLAVIVGALLSYAVGAFWYSLFFKRPWMREMNLAPESLKGGGMTPRMYAIGFLAELATAYVLVHFIVAFGGSPFEGAVWAWFGFQAPLLINSVLYEGRSWKLYAINAGYRFAGFLAMATAFVLFG